MSTFVSFSGNCCSKTLYGLDLISRCCNIGGITHGLVGRDTLQNALNRADPQNDSVWRAALRGGLVGQRVLYVLSKPYSCVVGTGLHRLAPGEDPAAYALFTPPSARAPRASVAGRLADAVGRPLWRLWQTVKRHEKMSHEERVDYLGNRFRQLLHHPSDIGLLGAIGLWATCPGLLVGSMISVGFGVLGSTMIYPVVYGVLTLFGKRPPPFMEFVSDQAASMSANSAMLMFYALLSAPSWIGLQGLRVAGASVIGAGIAVGMGGGTLLHLAKKAGTALAAAITKPPAKPARSCYWRPRHETLVPCLTFN